MNLRNPALGARFSALLVVARGWLLLREPKRARSAFSGTRNWLEGSGTELSARVELAPAYILAVSGLPILEAVESVEELLHVLGPLADTLTTSRFYQTMVLTLADAIVLSFAGDSRLGRAFPFRLPAAGTHTDDEQLTQAAPNASPTPGATNVATWQSYQDPERILAAVGPLLSRRKLRLFACHCCRHIFPLLGSQEQQIVRLAEQHAEGNLADVILGQHWVSICSSGSANQAVTWAAGVAGFTHADEVERARQSADAAARTLADEARRTVEGQQDGETEEAANARANEVWHHRFSQTERELAGILRELAGNPFRPIHIDPAWLELDNGRVRNGAEFICHHEKWDDLPRLADALEEAGCTEAIILDHLRQSGIHVHGCWALDLLLGKE